LMVLALAGDSTTTTEWPVMVLGIYMVAAVLSMPTSKDGADTRF